MQGGLACHPSLTRNALSSRRAGSRSRACGVRVRASSSCDHFRCVPFGTSARQCAQTSRSRRFVAHSANTSGWSPLSLGQLSSPFQATLPGGHASLGLWDPENSLVRGFMSRPDSAAGGGPWISRRSRIRASCKDTRNPAAGSRGRRRGRTGDRSRWLRCRTGRSCPGRKSRR